MIYSFINIKLQYEALHHWENADSIPEVSFLKHPHRHIFYIECTKRVSEDDRQIEFIILKREVEKWLLEKYNHNFGGMSCEMIAREILTQFDFDQVEVSEDRENGAMVINIEINYD